MDKVTAFKKASELPVMKVAAALVVPEKKRKNTAQASSAPVNESKLETSTSKISKTNKNSAKDSKDTNETISSDFGNQEEVYEFDEIKQDPDHPQEIKGVIKNVTKTSAKEAASYTCMICSYETNKKNFFLRHLKSHSVERPYRCSVCERGFKTKNSLINHRNTHLGYKPYSCSSCDMAFTTSGALVRHVRYRHTLIKPHKCTECDYCSVELSKLRRHMRCHTSERPYQCPHCTYAFPDTLKLKRHMRVHTGEKPYECNICHARFTRSNSLKDHRLKHSANGKLVFQCHLCPTTCGRKTDLRLHVKNLHNSDQPIPCKRCGKELADRYTLRMHVKTHIEEEKRHRIKSSPIGKKDHKCPHCKRSFAFNGNLIRHMEIHAPFSRLFEKKEMLKIGRTKQVQPDRTVVDNNLVALSEENEEQQAEDEEIQEEAEAREEFKVHVKEEYENFEGFFKEYEEQQPKIEELKEEDKSAEEYEDIIDIKEEKMQTIDIGQSDFKESITVKAGGDSDDFEIMSLIVRDDQGLMVIDALPDDDDDKLEQQQPPEELKKEWPEVDKLKINNKRNNNFKLIKAHKKLNN